MLNTMLKMETLKDTTLLSKKLKNFLPLPKATSKNLKLPLKDKKKMLKMPLKLYLLEITKMP
jgi:hypothetical protein